MENFKKYLLSAIKWFIVVIAVGNLILLFVFDYKLPFLGSAAAVTETPADSDSSEAESVPLIQIQVPEQAMIYDGTDTLDLLEDVVVTDGSGTALTDIKVFSSIKAGSSRKEKIIEYSATDEHGIRVTAQRVLRLGENYIGPTIELLDNVPEMAEEDLSSLMSVLLSGNLLRADDGFGKDVSSAVTSSVKKEADASGEATVTLTITNMINDSFSIDVSVPTRINGPVIHLTTDKVTLSVGDSFSFYNYVDSAYDEEGNDLSRYISIDGSVDTSTPGEYILKFHCTDTDGNASPVKTLTVTVQ